jgi:malate synthase
MTITTSDPAPVVVADLRIDPALYAFVTREAMPGTGVREGEFWLGLADLFRELAPVNAALLQRRDQLQERIDA